MQDKNHFVLKISIRTEISRTGNSLLDILTRTGICRTEFSRFISFPTRTEISRTKIILFENLYQDRNQKNKGFTRLISFLGQKYAGQNFLCFYNPSGLTSDDRISFCFKSESGQKIRFLCR